MTIKQQGGIFGRNPTFNDLTVDGEFVSNGNVDISGTASIDDQVTVEKNAPASVGPKLYLHNTANDGNLGHAAEIRFNLRAAEETSRNALIGAKALGTYGSDPYIYFSTSETSSGEPTERVKVLNTGHLELVSGNLVIGTSGQGIDFSATADGSGTTDNELFDDYEEGTWTPVDASGAGLTFTTSNTHYTKIGNMVMVTGIVTYPATADASAAIIGGLPYAAKAASTGFFPAVNTASLNIVGNVSAGSANFYLSQPETTNSRTNANMSGKLISFSGTYLAS